MKRWDLVKSFGWVMLLGGALLFGACGSSDKKSENPPTDGDEATESEDDTETQNEDDTLIEQDGDVENEAAPERCTAASNTLCFVVNDPKGSLSGPYTYVPNEVLASGCTLDGQNWQVDMYQTATSQVNIIMSLTAYDGAKTYATTATGLNIKWKPTTSSGSTMSWHSSPASFPCSLTLSDANTGTFDCTLLNMDDETHSLTLSGAFSCKKKAATR